MCPGHLPSQSQWTDSGPCTRGGAPVIGFLNGEVAVTYADGCIFDVGGVGYRLACSATTLGALPATGQTARLWTHMHVREDVLALYGFATEAERVMFEALIG